ncbi:hypothetical protein OG900_22385 [Streptomyces sp. NBC_00433]
MGWRSSIEGVYVGAVAVLALLGAVRADGHYYLAAIVLALPCGIAAVVAIYGGYALLSGVGGLFASRTVADGSDAGWLTAGSGTLNVLVLTAAAIGNVVLLRRRKAVAR